MCCWLSFTCSPWAASSCFLILCSSFFDIVYIYQLSYWSTFQRPKNVSSGMLNLARPTTFPIHFKTLPILYYLIMSNICSVFPTQYECCELYFTYTNLEGEFLLYSPQTISLLKVKYCYPFLSFLVCHRLVSSLVTLTTTSKSKSTKLKHRQSLQN